MGGGTRGCGSGTVRGWAEERKAVKDYTFKGKGLETSGSLRLRPWSSDQISMKKTAKSTPPRYTKEDKRYEYLQKSDGVFEVVES